MLQRALVTAEAANPVLTATLPTGGTIATAFGTLATGLANQLKQVARLIEARSALGVKRQFFFVSLGGFDNHTALLGNQATLYGQLVPALKAFYDYTVAAGVAANVTSFTMSDFSRTFVGNSTQGTDHAWGAHQLVLGGAVRGADIYGSFPTARPQGPRRCGQQRLVAADDRGGPGRRDARALVRRRRRRPSVRVPEHRPLCQRRPGVHGLTEAESGVRAAMCGVCLRIAALTPFSVLL